MRNEKFIAIIPARGGSKRLPNKNILEIAGKPLIAWTIEVSLENLWIEKTLVTSDSEEILSIAKGWGAESILRPSELALDHTPSFDAIQHALHTLPKPEKYDWLILLQPTSPLRSSKHIDDAIDFLFKKQADAVISVTEVSHILKSIHTLPPSQQMDHFHPDKNLQTPEKSTEKQYIPNGAIFICRISRLLEEKTFYLSTNRYAYCMPREVSVDIDEKVDFDFATFLLNRELNSPS